MQKKSEDKRQRNPEEAHQLAQERAAGFERQAEDEINRADEERKRADEVRSNEVNARESKANAKRDKEEALRKVEDEKSKRLELEVEV